MKRILLIALLAFGAWKGYEHFVGPKLPASSSSAPMMVAAAVDPATPATPAFRCDGRQYCTQMNSRAEAEFFVRNCPNTKMDGDRDGEPCENDSRF